VIRLVNPGTGVRLEYEGRWLRPGPATDGDVRRGSARFRGDKVYLSLPPGVQIQLDSGHLQVDTDYLAREQLAAAETVEASQPKGNASHETWLSYAVAQGMTRDEAAGLTRDQIKARFTAPSFDPDAPPDGLEILNPDDAARA
jgi:hypothetical protein